MVTETPVKPQEDEVRSRRMTGSIADLAHDAAQLIELQWELLREDVRQAGSRARVPAMLLAGGVALIAASVPVLLLGLGLLLSYAGIELAASLLIVAIIAVVLGVALAFSAWKTSRSIARCLETTRVEFKQNLTWLKGRLQKTTRE